MKPAFMQHLAEVGERDLARLAASGWGGDGHGRVNDEGCRVNSASSGACLSPYSSIERLLPSRFLRGEKALRMIVTVANIYDLCGKSPLSKTDCSGLQEGRQVSELRDERELE